MQFTLEIRQVGFSVKSSSMSSISIDDLITQSDAARLRGVSRQAIHTLIQRGKLSTYVVAGHVLVSRTEVENFKEGRRGRRPASSKGTQRKK
jgi:excisionase family DNA binding protein